LSFFKGMLCLLLAACLFVCLDVSLIWAFVVHNALLLFLYSCLIAIDALISTAIAPARPVSQLADSAWKREGHKLMWPFVRQGSPQRPFFVYTRAVFLVSCVGATYLVLNTQ
jgi:hypothetical protein